MRRTITISVFLLLAAVNQAAVTDTPREIVTCGSAERLGFWLWRHMAGDALIDWKRAERAGVRVSRAEADAFHIITFALVEAVYDVFLEGRRTSR